MVITADAVNGQSYEGKVTRVSVAGNTSGGTTTYPVTIRIDQTEGLRPGMMPTQRSLPPSPARP